MAPSPQWKVPGPGLEERWGFDKDAVPHPWLMVERSPNSDKALLLDFAIGKLVRIDRPRIADIRESGMVGQSREFWIKGKMPGLARIEVRDPRTNRLETVLEVSVKNQRFRSVSFHFVEDRAGDTTTRKFEEVEDILRNLNEIYSSQANVKFRLGRSSLLKVSIDLDDVVGARTDEKGYLLTGEAHIYGKKMWQKIFATKEDRSADFNVYFVPADDPNNRNDLFFIEGSNCVIEDGFVSVDFLLPHAIGRMLGCPPTSNGAHIRHLMYWGAASATWLTPRQGAFIPKECANLINP